MRAPSPTSRRVARGSNVSGSKFFGGAAALERQDATGTCIAGPNHQTRQNKCGICNSRDFFAYGKTGRHRNDGMRRVCQSACHHLAAEPAIGLAAHTESDRALGIAAGDAQSVHSDLAAKTSGRYEFFLRIARQFASIIRATRHPDGSQRLRSQGPSRSGRANRACWPRYARRTFVTFFSFGTRGPFETSGKSDGSQNRAASE